MHVPDPGQRMVTQPGLQNEPNQSAIRGSTTGLGMARSSQLELLEQGLGSREDVSENLLEMERINRRLGGYAAVTRHLYPRLVSPGAEKTPRVLDLGTGSGGLLRVIGHWAEKHGRDVELIGLDCAPRHLEQAAIHSRDGQRLELILADALEPPFSAQGVDFCVSTLLLHHLTPAQVVELLIVASNLTARSLIFSDLVRGWLPHAAFKLISPVFARHPFTRLDGALSVRRAYTPGELRRMARAAGLHNVRVVTHFPWRMTVIADCSPVKEGSG